MGVKRERGKPTEIGLPWSLLIVPVLFILAGLSIPYGLVAIPVQRRRERIFREQIEAQGRTMKWSDFLGALGEHRGTFIEERYSFKGPDRWWWSPEDVYEVCPYPTVDWLTMHKDNRFRPVAEWFRRRYTGLHDGRAFLVTRDGASIRELRSLRSGLESSSSSVRWIEVPPPESFRRDFAGKS